MIKPVSWMFMVLAAAALAAPSATSMAAPAILAVDHAKAFSVLHEFTGTDAAYPVGGLVTGTDGAFYGVTGASHETSANEWGVLYRIDAEGNMTTLHDFEPNISGAFPMHLPILSSDGHLYGTTQFGGEIDGEYGDGDGTIYRASLDGSDFEVVYSFSFDRDLLAQPDRIVQGVDGTLYGIASNGLNATGGIFAISPTGSLSVLHQFVYDGSEGLVPDSVIIGGDGTLWGTMAEGGRHQDGVAWHVTLDGAFQVIHEFDNSDGRSPRLWLSSADGSFYGTTSSGGPSGGGTVFRMTPSGKITTLYGFGSQPFDGYNPYGLMRTPDGIFHGATAYGGKNGGAGTIYRLTESGQLNTVHDFGTKFRQGLYPDADALAIGNDGALYGGCDNGGNADALNQEGMGTLFRVTP